MVEFALNPFERLLRVVELARGQRRRFGGVAAGPLEDRQGRFQIAPQGVGGSGRRGRLLRLPRFQEQLGLLENALANGRGSAAPGRVELSGLAGGEAVAGEDFRHPLTILAVETGHRHQVLQGQVRLQTSLAHLFLDRFRQQFGQRQPARHPAHAAVEAAGQLRQVIAEVLFQLRQQPALFQRRLRLLPTLGAVQQQRIGLAQRPHHGLDHVVPQLLERGQALEAVDHQVAARFTLRGDHHDRGLLARFGQRRQQAPLLLGAADPQVFQSPVELVKLQLHGGCGQQNYPAGLAQPPSGLSRPRGRLCWNSLENQQHSGGSSLLRSAAAMPRKR